MLVLLLATPFARAAGTAPDDRMEASVEGGVVTARGAVGFGLGGGLRRGPFTFVATGGFGGRIDIGGSGQPGYGLGSVALGLDTDADGMRIGAVLLTDWVVLDTSEQDCSVRFGCRHEWFVGLEVPPTLGIGVEPATGVRLSGDGPSGASWSATFAWQPSIVDDELWWFVPRLDLAVWGAADNLSVHAWAGRYGVALGLGYRLTRRPE